MSHSGMASMPQAGVSVGIADEGGASVSASMPDVRGRGQPSERGPNRRAPSARMSSSGRAPSRQSMQRSARRLAEGLVDHADRERSAAAAAAAVVAPVVVAPVVVAPAVSEAVGPPAGAPPVVEACSALAAEYGDTVCEICQERIYAPEMIDVCPHYCKHVFCVTCMHKLKMMSDEAVCPFCRCLMPRHHHYVRPTAGTPHRKGLASNAKRLVQLLLSMDDSRRWCCAAPSVGAICREEGLCNPEMTLAEAQVHNAAGAVCMRDRVKCPHRYCTYVGSVHEIATVHAPFCSLIGYTECEEEECKVGVNPLVPREVHNVVCTRFNISCLVPGCESVVPRCLMHEHLNKEHPEDMHCTELRHVESFKLNPVLDQRDTHDRSGAPCPAVLCYVPAMCLLFLPCACLFCVCLPGQACDH